MCRAIFLTQIQWNFLYTKGAATSRFLSDVAAFYCSLFIPVKKEGGGKGRCLLLWCDFILRALIIRLIEVGLETVLSLTCYHCLGMSELFSDLVIAQCCLVFGCSLTWLSFLHRQSVHYHLSVLEQQSDARCVD